MDANGLITSVAGTNGLGYSGDGGAATNARLSYPRGVALDSAGNLFIADTSNQRIRNVSYSANPALAFNYLTTNNSGSYSVVVTSPYGSLTSSVSTLSVAGWPPQLTSPPTGAAVPTGGSTLFAVTATGDLPLGYQWQFNGATVAGATDSALGVSNVQPASAGSYQVVVTNAFGATTSSPAILCLLLTNADGSLAAPPNLQNWWPAENNAHDVLGANDGTAQAGVSYTLGKCGRAFSLNGTATALIVLGAVESPRPGAPVAGSTASSLLTPVPP